MTRRKITAEEMAAVLAQTVGEIVDSDVVEVAAVDRPATGKLWRFFKAAPPQPEGLVNYTACLERDPTATPTVCEAAGEPDSRGDLTDALRADMGGHEATLADAKMLAEVDAAIERGEFGSKVAPEGVDPAEFERCVQEVMDQGNEKSSAYAICTEGGAGAAKEVRPMKQAKCPGPEAAKDFETAPPVPTEEEMIAAEGEAPPSEPESIEIPAKPTKWGLADCLTEATDMGLPENDGVAACQMIRADFGNPNDEAEILVPEGTTTEGLINSAAMTLGLGKSLKQAPTGAPMVKFTGRNVWRGPEGLPRLRRLWNKFVGISEPRPGAKLIAWGRGVEARLGGIMVEQVKTNARVAALTEQNGQLIRLLAGAIGVELPAGAAPVEVPAGAPADLSAPAGDVNPLVESKSQKDGAAGNAPVPAAPTLEERMAAFERQLAEIIAALTAAPAPVEEDTDEDDDLSELVGAAPSAPAPAIAPKRVSVPTAGPVPGIKSGVLSRVTGGKSSPAGALAPGMEFSTILGVPLSSNEIDSVRPQGPGFLASRGANPGGI